MPKITPFLWFDGQAEEAAKHYVSIFPNSKILTTTRYGAAGPGPKGSVMTVDFELDGRRFTALNGGPEFKFNESVSFVIECKTQKEVDTYWEKLLDGGQESQCGWLKDRFGLSWQVTPVALLEMIGDPDPKKVARVMEVMMTMRKLEIEPLKRAYEGK
jgi:predicted 3-demethylubiquinone-9 3-methyltransferase (glyoxalase superfamily)